MDLYDKIIKIEALIESTSSEGERSAAEQAKQRLQERIEDTPIEYQVRSHSSWEKHLFVAVCKKNGLSPYRYRRQKFTSTMVRVSKDTMNRILWPEYERYAKLLRNMVDEIADDLIGKIHRDDEEETVISGEITAVRG